jgi:uncharacterized protein YpuA (DUF1002 family)
MKKILLAIVLLLLFTPTALADSGDAKTAVGADLTKSQKETVYELFGIEQDVVEEIQVTIDEEKAYLGDIITAEKIGTRSLSSVYVMEMDEDYGITVDTHNINWVTSEMYIAALTTAGIEDAMIVVAAPIEVSGTAALTGLFKAYESITGDVLKEEVKDTAGEELFFTGKLAELLGTKEAIEFMTELKAELAKSEDMSDEEIRQIIIDKSTELNIELTSSQIDELIKLLRKIAKMDLTPETILDMSEQIERSLNKFKDMQEDTKGFMSAVINFFNKIGEWLRNLFS